jgi:hypothetical protein
MFMFRLAKELHKTVEEIMQMSSVEYRGWIEYFNWISQEEKKANKKASRRR